MSKGKISSQACHAILDVHRFLINSGIDHREWLNSGEKIVVLKSDHKTMKQLIEEFSDKIDKKNTLNFFPIYDAGRTEIESGSLTVLATTPITDDKKIEVLKRMKLV
jgi:PTH2 family peptidyl-tRNA hydrolase